MRGSGGTATYLAQNQTIHSVAKVLLEINQNRYLAIDAVSDSVYGAGDFTPYFKDRFPLTDVILPVRPPAGAFKARFGSYSFRWQGPTTLNNIESASTSYTGYRVPTPRMYYPGTGPNLYRYFSTNTLLPTIALTYTSSVWANKVVVTIENSVEWPSTWTIQAKISGVWTTIATNPNVNPSTNKTGTVNVYRSGGSWSTTAPTSPALTDAVQIDGLRVVITAMNTTTSHLNIIEMSPRLVADVTAYLEDWSWDENLSEQDALTPVGVISSGSGSVTFSNTGQDWESRVSHTPPSLSMLAQKYAILTAYETINAEVIKMFTVQTDTWTIAEGDVAKAQTFDDSQNLQGVACPELLMQDVSPTAAIIRLLDNAGFGRYKIRRVSGESEVVIPYFYCNSDQNVWQTIQDLCKSHQYAVWVDADGDFNIATMNWLYNRTGASTTWTFRAVDSGGNYADIIDHSEQTGEPINNVIITFKEQSRSRSPGDLNSATPTGVVADNIFAFRKLYDPNSHILLGCVQMKGSITDVATTIPVDVNAFRNIQWDVPLGYALIDQEIIKLGAAQFGYVDTTGNYKIANISTDEDWTDMLTDAVGNITFKGNFVNCERGALGTTPAAHGLVLSNWHTPSGDSKYASTTSDSTGNAFLRLYKSTAGTDYKMSLVRDTGAAYTRFFTRVDIANQTTPQRAAGMVIWAHVNGSNVLTGGWYIELRSSEKQKKEVALVRILSTGKLDRANQRVYDYPILESTNYDLTVYVLPGSSSGYTKFQIFVNNHLVASPQVLNSQVAKSSSVALMATGRTLALFDFFAAANGALTDDSYTAHISSIIRNLFSERDSLVQGITMFYEGFDDRLKGVYVDNVRFDKDTPALEVNMYPVINAPNTDKTQKGVWIAKSTDVAYALDQITPFSTKVAIGNISNRPIALDDGTSAIYPYIYGPVIESKGQIQVTSKDEDAIRRVGEKKYEASPLWLTTRQGAQNLADQIVSVSKNGLQTHDVSCFDNPLLEIGDIVTINYPRKNMNSDETFIIYEISRSRAEGIETSVKLVKVEV